MKEKNVDKIMTGGSIINSSEISSSADKVLSSNTGGVTGNSESVISGDPAAGIVSGIVKWFSPEKGFGFVTCSDGRDIFVYYTEIQTEGFKTLKKGQKVAMEIFSGERGPQASNVRLI